MADNDHSLAELAAQLTAPPSDIEPAIVASMEAKLKRGVYTETAANGLYTIACMTPFPRVRILALEGAVEGYSNEDNPNFGKAYTTLAELDPSNPIFQKMAEANAEAARGSAVEQLVQGALKLLHLKK